MVKDLYQKSFSVLMKRPFRLWGLSLLAGVLLFAAQAGFIGVPAVAFCAALLLGVPPDAVLTEAEEAMAAIGELTGASIREDITNRIFARFCVGK